MVFNQIHYKILSKVLANVQPARFQYSDEETWEIASETFDTFVKCDIDMLSEHGDRFDSERFSDSIVDNFLS